MKNLKYEPGNRTRNHIFLANHCANAKFSSAVATHLESDHKSRHLTTNFDKLTAFGRVTGGAFEAYECNDYVCIVIVAKLFSNDGF